MIFDRIARFSGRTYTCMETCNVCNKGNRHHEQREPECLSGLTPIAKVKLHHVHSAETRRHNCLQQIRCLRQINFQKKIGKVPSVGAYYSLNRGSAQGIFPSFLEMEKTAGAYLLVIYDYLRQIQRMTKAFLLIVRHNTEGAPILDCSHQYRTPTTISTTEWHFWPKRLS